MMFKTHEIAGVVACTAVIPFIDKMGIEANILNYGLIFAGGAIGAMFPDIDSPTSKIRRIIRKAFTGNPNTEKRLINHRRAPHMPLFWIAIFAILFFAFSNPLIETFIWGMAVGVASHLFIDMFNPAGIPFFGPLTRKKIHLMSIYTNTTGETVFSIILVVLEIFIIYYYVVSKNTDISSILSSLKF